MLSQVFSFLLIFTALTTAFNFTSPPPGSTIDLTSQNIKIAWTHTASDPVHIDIWFGASYFASSLGPPLNTSFGSYAWNARKTASSMMAFNRTLYLGEPFFLYADDADKPTPPIAYSGNFSIKGYAGPTNTGAYVSQNEAAGLLRKIWVEVVLALGVGALLV